MRKEIFYGNVVLEVDGREVKIDSRPSDALNLAIRTNVPIFVAREVMDSAGIVPEEDEVEAGEMVDVSEHTDTSEERLSVFEDFLEQLDLEDDEEDED